MKLSPLDVNRPLWAWLDAAKTVGMSYILVQPKSDNEADVVTIISHVKYHLLLLLHLNTCIWFNESFVDFIE